MQKIMPCLWFDGQAQEAAQFYTSLFKNSRIKRSSHYPESASAASGQKAGSVMTCEFELDGYSFLGLNGGPHFQFTQAVSLFVACETEDELNRLWKELSKNGTVRWELKQYPWAEKYGWCEDRFGLSWQLILGAHQQKIAPAFLFVDQLYGKGAQAIEFYTSTFPQSKILSMHQDPQTKMVMHSTFSLLGQNFILMEGQGTHQIPVTPAFSLMVNCKDQNEINQYWEALSQGGSKGQCGWLTDKFGVSWQIIPDFIGDFLTNSDPMKVDRVMSEVIKMTKIEIDRIQGAYKA